MGSGCGMGGLTALVWLPDEVIAHETAATPPGLRRLEAAGLGGPGSGGTVPGLGAPGRAMPPDPLDGPGAATEAWTAARAPRFTDRAADDAMAPTGTLDAPGGWDAGAPDPQGAGAPDTWDAGALDPRDAGILSAPEARTMLADPPPAGALATGGVVVPAAVSAAEESRLPIFESVESDWFRRSRQSNDGASAGAPVAAWSSPVDEGWRAAEVAHAPVSEGQTAAGLPQRVPKANLVPGRAGLAGAGAVMPPAPPRSAAQTQARLAGFQRAVRDARAAAQAAADADAGAEEPGQAADLSLPGKAAGFGTGEASGWRPPCDLSVPGALPVPGGLRAPGQGTGVTRAACSSRCWRRHTGCQPRRSRCRTRTPAAECRPGWHRRPRRGTAPRCR